MADDQEWRILLIDDDEDDYLLTKSMLSQFQGRKVKLEWASTYDAGYQELSSSTYDAVLVDYDLSPRTGIELIRELVAQEYPAPLILYTGRGSYAVDVEAMLAGATLYVTKTEATPLLLERSIRYAIERKQIEHALRASNEQLTASNVQLAFELSERKRAEQQLDIALAAVVDERNRLQAVMETLPIGVAIVDAQGGNIQANFAFEKVWGGLVPEANTVADYVAFKAWWADTGQPVKPEEWASARAVREGETVIGQILQIERFDGTRAFVHNSGAPVLDAQGQIVGSTVAIMDITEQKQAEHRQETLRERRAFLFQVSLDVIAEKTVQGLLDKVVAAACLLTNAQVAVCGHSFQHGHFTIEASSRSAGAASCSSAENFLQELGGFYLDLVRKTGSLRLTDEELRRHPNWREWPAGHNPIRGLLGASMLDTAGQAMGLILVVDKEQGDFTEDDEALLKQLAAVTSLALQQIEARLQAEQRAAELRESDERLRLALEIGEIGFAEIDYISGIITYDPVFQSIWGLGESPSPLEMIQNIVHPDDQTRIAAVRARAFDPQVRDDFSVEYRILRPDGETRWISTRGRNFFDEAANPTRPVRFFGVIQDITARKQAEEHLYRLNRTLQALSNSNQTLMRATDQSTLLTQVCQNIVADCDYTMAWIGFAEEDEEKSVRPVAYAGFDQGYLQTLKISWADAERGSGPTGKAIRSGQPCICRNMLTDPAFLPWREQALERGYASSIAVPLMFEEKVFGALTIYSTEPDPFSDDEVKLLTELAGDLAYGISSLQMRAAKVWIDEELQLQQEWLRVTLTSIGDAVITTDQRGMVTFLNFAAEKLTGFTSQEAAGQPLMRVFNIVNELTGQPAEDPVGKVLESGLVIGLANHTALIDRQGRTIPIEDSAAPIKDNAGETLGIVIVFHDVSEKRMAEERIHHLASFPQLNPNPVLEVDFTGSVTFYNPAISKILASLGMDQAEVQMFVPDDIVAVIRALQAKNGASLNREVMIKDRVFREVIHLAPPSKTVHIYADEITQQKQAEQALRDSEEHFRLALRNTSVVVATLDRELRYTWIYNPQGGFQPEDVLGKKVGLSTDPESRDNITKSLQEVITHDITADWETASQTKLGEKYFASHAEPLRNLAGEITGVAYVSIDITERKRAEQAVRESEQKFSLIFEKAAFAAALSRLPEGVLVNVNEAWVKTFGYTRQEALGKTTLELNINPDVDARARIIAQLRERGFVRDFEASFRTKSGEWRVLSVNIDLVDIGGEQYILNTTQDITERKRAERTLNEQNERLLRFAEQLQRSNQALQDFAFVASHDLQDPLRKIQAYGDLLKSYNAQVLDDQGREYIDRMVQTSARMQSMLDGLLTYSRVEIQGRPFVRVDLTQAATEALTDLEVRLKQTGGRVDIQELPVIQADPVQMRQLFQNLIGNALKFHQPGIPPQVIVSGRSISEKEITLTIEDNGIGFEEKYIDRLFKPFHRLHAKSEYEGSGIGLAICRKIVERHGGSISVNSNPGDGTTFTVILPLEQT